MSVGGVVVVGYGIVSYSDTWLMRSRDYGVQK